MSLLKFLILSTQFNNASGYAYIGEPYINTPTYHPPF